ncbi:Cytidine deaminase [Anaerovibrio sp. JC8]|uniref:cytidine deaminase n=1 Tax=Anaerovibrio sp. JC8 TaxID=1240085 RepID=UPI000A0E5740|nr:cytidine deaminase [Anaerovibrio sp. JC8]ORU00059.1 Cytidine deaminase [Anaerovibrio sp. JC8]
MSKAVDFDRKKLIQTAMDHIAGAYAPYSGFHVSAALLMSDGRVYTGVNVENASYPAGICAERNAIFHAIAQDKNAKLVAVAIVGGPNGDIKDYCAPCGVCRQVMREFGNPADIRVIMAKSTEDYKEMTLEELLPMSFGPEFLK